MLKNEKGKFILSIAVTLLFIGFLVWQGVMAINGSINSSLRELKDKKITKDVYALKEKTSDQEREAYDFSKNKIEKINNYFVYASDNDDAEFTSFFGQLDDIAWQSTQKDDSLTIDQFQEAAAAAKNIKKTSIAKDSSSEGASIEDSRLLKLTLNSDYQGLLKFIYYLEAMPFYIYIESINIKIDGSAKPIKNLNKDILSSNSPNLQSILIIKVFRKSNIL